MLDGRPAAAVNPLHEGELQPHWKTYIAVADADAAAQAVSDAGGTVLDAPFDVADAGRAAICTDPAGGALFVLWQPARNRGAQAVNEDGAMSWNELDTRDLDGAEQFYGAVFGWEFERIEQDGRVVYATLKHGGRTIGGVLPMGDQIPAEVPPNWLVYFGAADLDATLDRAQQLGGSVVVPPMQVPAGRFVVLADPHGAVFAFVEGHYDPPP
jgi:predicted enzyme related to lactoylglutathione lyase